MHIKIFSKNNSYYTEALNNKEYEDSINKWLDKDENENIVIEKVVQTDSGVISVWYNTP